MSPTPTTTTIRATATTGATTTPGATATPRSPRLRYRAGVAWFDRWVARWRAADRDGRVRFEAVPDLAADFAFDDPEPADPEPGYVPNGESTGAEALARLRRHLGDPRWLRAWLGLPGGEAVLRIHHRVAFGWPRILGLLAWTLHGSDVMPRRYVWSRWLFMRLLGFCLVCAALSWWSQLSGLVGDNGILPAGEFLERVGDIAEQNDWSDTERRLNVPTLLWLDPSSDGLHHAIAAATAVASVLVLFNLFEGLALLVGYLGLLSLMAAGQVFSGYQWDALLLETAFAGLLVAVWLRPRPKLAEGGPHQSESAAGRWVLRVLIAKLMFLSGVVKLRSGDPTWADGTALTFHYWTQPLPAATSWTAHHLSPWFHSLGVWFTLAVELVLPAFALVGPRRLRILAALSFIALQLGIALTGNYGFFNLLTAALCLPLLDDAALAVVVPRRWRRKYELRPPVARTPARRWVAWPRNALAAVLIALSAATVGLYVAPGVVPQAASDTLDDLRGTHVNNGYGLFATMTTERPEILVEGSYDGRTWSPYVFRYKPGPLDRAPVFVGPHMPRLDWQMWFAALRGQCGRTRWYPAFLRRLLSGQPEVTALLASDPFGARPPRFIRSTLYDYHFTAPAEREASGNVWRRTVRGPYCPTVMLDARGRLVRAPVATGNRSQR